MREGTVLVLTGACTDKISDNTEFNFERMWLKSWMKIVESKDVLRIKRFLLNNCLQPKQY